MSVSSNTQAQEESAPESLSTQKTVEGWWKTSKAGKIYSEYDKAGILENPRGVSPGYEKLVPDHLDKNDKSKTVWNSPLGITYYIFEVDQTDRDGNKTGEKKQLIFRTPTSEYKNGGSKSNSWQARKPFPIITDEMTVLQIIGMDNGELKQNGWQSYQSDQVAYLMSDAGGKWKPAGAEFKQTHVDFAKREILIVYQLVQRAS